MQSLVNFLEASCWERRNIYKVFFLLFKQDICKYQLPYDKIAQFFHTYYRKGMYLQ